MHDFGICENLRHLRFPLTQRPIKSGLFRNDGRRFVLTPPGSPELIHGFAQSC